MTLKVTTIKTNKSNPTELTLSSKVSKYLVCMLGVACVSKSHHSDDML